MSGIWSTGDWTKGQLRELATASPLHEPLHARLIAALAASNLQGSALAAYTEIRRRLVDDLGIEPGPELMNVHRRVLRQEPSFDTAPPFDETPVLDKPRPPAQLPADSRFRADLLAEDVPPFNVDDG